MLRLGIFGGAFNPIHGGHLVLAETARDVLSLDRVLFIPTGQPPYKSNKGLAPGPVRLAMIRLAIRDHPAFAVSEIELERPGVSYALETVKTIQSRVGEAELFLLIGEDMLGVRWVGWDELKRLCTVVVARRPASRRTRREARLRWLDMPQVDIASSDIRARIRKGRSIRYLVPERVEQYIRGHRLYTR